MKHTINCPVYEVGELVNTAAGFVLIDAYLGKQGPNDLPTYRVISEDIKFVNGRPTNVFIMQIIPTPTLIRSEK